MSEIDSITMSAPTPE